MIKSEIFWHFSLSNQNKVSRMPTFCSNHWKELKLEGPFTIRGPWLQTYCDTKSIKTKTLNEPLVVFSQRVITIGFIIGLFCFQLAFQSSAGQNASADYHGAWGPRAHAGWRILSKPGFVCDKKKPEFASHINLTRNLI